MRHYFSVLLILFLAACNQKHRASWRDLTPAQRAARMDSLKNDLLHTDIAFSQLSEEKGRNAAFIEYADSDATMLRSFSMPVKGKDSVINLFKAHPDSTIKLSWIPIYADVAHSGDLGYTYGTYSITLNGTDTHGGTYCTIWKKDGTGKWKFLLGTGNHGLKAEDKKEE